MRYLIDANVFLHSALEQGKEAVCTKFLDRVSSGEIKAFATVFHIDAAAVIMQRNGMDGSEIGGFYRMVERSIGLEVVQLGIRGRIEALGSDEHTGLDDSLILRAYRHLEADALVTYDTDFDGEIRVSPEDVMEGR